MKKVWVITQDERDQHFVDTLKRIQENADILKDVALETESDKARIEASYNQILRDLKALKLYR